MLLFKQLITLFAVVSTVDAALQLDSRSDPSQLSEVVNQTSCNGKTYTYRGLGGYGYIPSNARDKYGDTIGGIGSSIAIERDSWKKTRTGYTGILWTLPDRGWNTQGTLNYQARVHKIQILFTPAPSASVTNPSAPNLHYKYLDTILLSDPTGKPTTGLDPDVTGGIKYPVFPTLPSATYEGDGFGGPGPGGKRVSLDSEGLTIASDGSFWVSDEYGPYIYHFSRRGQMVTAIQPPQAIIPRRNNTVSFSAASPPEYDPNRQIIPEDPDSGRSNNQGFEGLTLSPSGQRLFALLQSATAQEGGNSDDDTARRYSRLVEYDISLPLLPRYVAEYVVPLPLYNTTSKKGKPQQKVAAQSEIHALSDTQFLVLSRDSGAGHGQDTTTSLYRRADVFDISSATDIKTNANDAPTGAIASADGVLKDGIRPARYCSWLDYNVNSQLNKFGVHNGGADDDGLLNEKWESLALLPVHPGNNDGEYFLLSHSDNDFVTQDGYLNAGKFKYSDASGFDSLNQALLFRVTLPS